MFFSHIIITTIFIIHKTLLSFKKSLSNHSDNKKMHLTASKEYEHHYEKTGFLHMRKQRTQLISAFVLAIRIVQSPYYLNLKFQASSHLLWLYSPGCGTLSETLKTGFLTTRLIFIPHCHIIVSISRPSCLSRLTESCCVLRFNIPPTA